MKWYLLSLKERTPKHSLSWLAVLSMSAKDGYYSKRETPGFQNLPLELQVWHIYASGLEFFLCQVNVKMNPTSWATDLAWFRQSLLLGSRGSICSGFFTPSTTLDLEHHKPDACWLHLSFEWIYVDYYSSQAGLHSSKYLRYSFHNLVSSR